MKTLSRSPWKKHQRKMKEFSMEEVPSRQLSYPHSFDHEHVCIYCGVPKKAITDLSHCQAREQFEARR